MEKENLFTLSFALILKIMGQLYLCSEFMFDVDDFHTSATLHWKCVLISLNTHMEWKGFPWTWTHLTGGENNKHAVKNSLIWTSLALQSINVNSKECCHSLEFIILSLIISGKLRLNPKSFKPATPEGFDTFIPMMGVAFAWSLLHF